MAEPRVLVMSNARAGVEIAPLEGTEKWMTFEDAAATLNMTRPGFSYCVWHSQRFDHAKDIRMAFGKYVVRRTAVLAEKKLRDADVIETARQKAPRQRSA